MSSLVGLAAFWGACVAFFGPSLFTADGRAFWGGLWAFFCFYLPIWTKWLGHCLMACGEALCWACLRLYNYLCCCGCCRKGRKGDGKDDRKMRDLKMGGMTELNQAPKPGTSNEAPRSDGVTPAQRHKAPSGTRSNVPARPTPSTSASPSVSTTGHGLPAQGRRPTIPRGTVQPLGTNLGQAFDRPGNALAQGKAAVERRWIHFSSDGISLAGHLYVPSSNSSSNFASARRPAIVVGHPRGGVKEQTSGQYAREIAEQGGFITLAFDAAYQGESGGLPRYLEDPYQRANDVRNAVTYLSTLDIVDPDNIGALGVCASGGYVPFAAQTDKRVKAIATVSAVDLGVLNAEGFDSFNGPPLPNLNALLAEAGRQRTNEGRGADFNLTRVVPHNPSDVLPTMPVFYQEAHDYYRTSRGQHPTSPNLNLWRSIDLLATHYFSERAMEIAKEPKELYIIPGRTHIDLYDKTTESTPRLVEFFTENLQ
ncbi:hypothetical protein QQX98_010321 [Neonectria punicea]|uniref:Dienelactone hydrolase domain-containing protein n=1 Tax=Neonectria punicea TaxID=979145 RepID=A0ABR1GPT8_9HYPO